jgi:rubredoxin
MSILGLRRAKAFRKSMAEAVDTYWSIGTVSWRAMPLEVTGNDGQGSAHKRCCVSCDFIYDKALGIPREDIPVDRTYPDCAAGKDDFQMVEIDGAD